MVSEGWGGSGHAKSSATNTNDVSTAWLMVAPPTVAPHSRAHAPLPGVVVHQDLV